MCTFPACPMQTCPAISPSSIANELSFLVLVVWIGIKKLSNLVPFLFLTQKLLDSYYSFFSSTAEHYAPFFALNLVWIRCCCSHRSQDISWQVAGLKIGGVKRQTAKDFTAKDCFQRWRHLFYISKDSSTMTPSILNMIVDSALVQKRHHAYCNLYEYVGVWCIVLIVNCEDRMKATSMMLVLITTMQ